MWKILVVTSFIFSGCSHFTFNKQMCDQIASQPNAIVPQECMKYSEKDAQKAFDNIKNKHKTSNKDIIKFEKKD